MTYIENEKLPEDRGNERINNRFVSILGEIKRLKDSLHINQTKIRDLIKKEIEENGNTVIINGQIVQGVYGYSMPVIMFYTKNEISVSIRYDDITSIVVERR